jgi:hypothetical protein
MPVLCIENGLVILRFSEIFGLHEPLKKGDKRDHRYSIPKGIDHRIRHLPLKAHNLLISSSISISEIRFGTCAFVQMCVCCSP